MIPPSCLQIHERQASPDALIIYTVAITFVLYLTIVKAIGAYHGVFILTTDFLFNAVVLVISNFWRPFLVVRPFLLVVLPQFMVLPFLVANLLSSVLTNLNLVFNHPARIAARNWGVTYLKAGEDVSLCEEIVYIFSEQVFTLSVALPYLSPVHQVLAIFVCICKVGKMVWLVHDVRMPQRSRMSIFCLILDRAHEAPERIAEYLRLVIRFLFLAVETLIQVCCLANLLASPFLEGWVPNLHVFYVVWLAIRCYNIHEQRDIPALRTKSSSENSLACVDVDAQTRDYAKQLLACDERLHERCHVCDLVLGVTPASEPRQDFEFRHLLMLLLGLSAANLMIYSVHSMSLLYLVRTLYAALPEFGLPGRFTDFLSIPLGFEFQGGQTSSFYLMAIIVRFVSLFPMSQKILRNLIVRAMGPQSVKFMLVYLGFEVFVSAICCLVNDNLNVFMWIALFWLTVDFSSVILPNDQALILKSFLCACPENSLRLSRFRMFAFFRFFIPLWSCEPSGAFLFLYGALLFLAAIGVLALLSRSSPAQLGDHKECTVCRKKQEEKLPLEKVVFLAHVRYMMEAGLSFVHPTYPEYQLFYGRDDNEGVHDSVPLFFKTLSQLYAVLTHRVFDPREQSFIIDDYICNNQQFQIWGVKQFGAEHYIFPTKCRDNILAAVQKADREGAKVVGLGFLCKMEFVTAGGQYLANHMPNRKVKIITGNTLTAACMIQAFRDYVPQNFEGSVFTIGSTSSIAVVSLAVLCSEYPNIQFYAYSPSKSRLTDLVRSCGDPKNLIVTSDVTTGLKSILWLACGWDFPSEYIPYGTTLINVSHPLLETPSNRNIEMIDCGLMENSSEFVGSRSFTIFQRKKEFFACNAALFLNPEKDELGVLNPDDIDPELEKAAKAGLSIKCLQDPQEISRVSQRIVDGQKRLQSVINVKSVELLKAADALEPTTVDVLVIGAGPAGMAAAARFVNSGFSVSLWDPNSIPLSQLNPTAQLSTSSQMLRMPLYKNHKVTRKPFITVRDFQEYSQDYRIALGLHVYERTFKASRIKDRVHLEVEAEDGFKVICKSLMMCVGNEYPKPLDSPKVLSFPEFGAEHLGHKEYVITGLTYASIAVVEELLKTPTAHHHNHITICVEEVPMFLPQMAFGYQLDSVVDVLLKFPDFLGNLILTLVAMCAFGFRFYETHFPENKSRTKVASSKNTLIINRSSRFYNALLNGDLSVHRGLSNLTEDRIELKDFTILRSYDLLIACEPKAIPKQDAFVYSCGPRMYPNAAGVFTIRNVCQSATKIASDIVYAMKKRSPPEVKDPPSRTWIRLFRTVEILLCAFIFNQTRFFIGVVLSFLLVFVFEKQYYNLHFRPSFMLNFARVGRPLVILIILYLVYNFFSLCGLVSSSGSVTALLQMIL